MTATIATAAALAARGGFRDELTRAEAAYRSARVSDVSCDMRISLEADSDRYRGEATIRFDRVGEGDLWLEFTGGGVKRFAINGVPADPGGHPHRLALPEAALRGRNEVTVAWEHAFQPVDEFRYGFFRSDANEGDETLYTNFEPFGAHRMFPCFDQPDLKGTYGLTVDAPGRWTVVANAPETGRAPLGRGRARRFFARTAPLPPYLVALCAGDFRSFRGDWRGIPIGIHCRRAIGNSVAEIAPGAIALVRDGIAFYERFCGYPYPFGKYDLTLVPGFSYAAMENAGAVVMNERQRRSSGMGEVILHETAHMWFGNLVTLRWWDALGFQESGASVLAHMAEHAITGAYGKDIEPTPAGERIALSLALRRYFREYAWGNASQDDFARIAGHPDWRWLRQKPDARNSVGNDWLVNALPSALRVG